MRDPRLDKLARVITEYSTDVKPGQLVRISGDPVGLPLLEAIYEAVLRRGAHPQLRISPDHFKEIFYEVASEEQLRFVSPLAEHAVRTIDVEIGLWAETNTKALSRVDPGRQRIASAARAPIMQTFMERAAKGDLKWCGTLYPTPSSAQDAEMGLRDYENFVFHAGHLDKADPVAEWRKIEKQQQQVVDYLTGKKELRFQAANGTDLTVNVEGMAWINCAGRENFPDGEVFTGPNLDAEDGGVNGVVRYSFPAVHGGREVHGVELEFDRGKLVSASATKNEDFLKQMIEQDEGASRLGEIAIGTNYAITEYSRNTLFDEKIGGTFHAALGAGYPETGNANRSGLHWDMVCDLREGGTITADGEVFHKDGQFIFDGWPGRV
ncbi:MAG: aminopeptidase [Phycisphaeraceae bacterium]